PRLAACVQEAEKGKGLRFPVATSSPVPRRRATEFDEACLVRMQRQPELREALTQRGEEAYGLLPMLESDDEVVGKPDDHEVALRLPIPPSLDPEVERVVEIDSGQQRTDTAALDRTDLTPHPLPVLQHAGPQPLRDEAHDALVPNTVLHKANEPSVVERIEEATDVRVEHPVHASRFDPDRQRIQRVVRAASRAKPVRDAEKVLFVNRAQHVDDGTLDDFVFQRGNAERPLPPVRLRNVHASNRARSERTPLDAGGKVSKVFFERLAVLSPCFAIDAGCRVSRQRKIGGAQACQIVHMVQQRGEPLFSVPSRGLTYSLEAIRRWCPALGSNTPRAGGLLDVAVRLAPRRRHPGVNLHFAARYLARAFPCQRFAVAVACADA